MPWPGNRIADSSPRALPSASPSSSDST
jgi:hypothetical protein